MMYNSTDTNRFEWRTESGVNVGYYAMLASNGFEVSTYFQWLASSSTDFGYTSSRITTPHCFTFMPGVYPKESPFRIYRLSANHYVMDGYLGDFYSYMYDVYTTTAQPYGQAICLWYRKPGNNYYVPHLKIWMERIYRPEYSGGSEATEAFNATSSWTDLVSNWNTQYNRYVTYREYLEPP